MVLKKNKILKITLITVGCTFAVFFGVNLYLFSRLEAFLKEELSIRVSEATDRFYNLSFSSLSVDFFSGELSINDIELKPDSAIFSQWEAIDSLPENYVKLKISSIDLKGINLIWKINRRRLNFKLFEVKSPDITIFESYYSTKFKKKTKNTDQKTLYEMIQPYVEVLSVKIINLEDAKIAYIVEDPDVSGIYSLGYANFNAYGFVLDKESQSSGKLLYCDGFEFTANCPQTLLANKEFILNTDSIRLSTKDSIIRINGISLKARDSLWVQEKDVFGNYLNAKVRAVEVKGIQFERRNSLTYLDARMFNIESSNIEYYSTAKQESDEEKKKPNDIIDTSSYSLYDIVSPVLHKVSIKNIGLSDAYFKYTVNRGSSADVYTLNKLDFSANGFLLDSLSAENEVFLYSENFRLDARNFSAQVSSENQSLSIERVFLDTKEGGFGVNSVLFRPIFENSKYDYLDGRLDSLNIVGLEYNKGLNAKLLTINKPNVRYVRNLILGGATATAAKPQGNNNVFDKLVSTYLGHLSVKNIRLDSGNFRFEDNTTTSKDIYNLNRLSFFADDFKIDSSTIAKYDVFFECSNLGFRFFDFDNVLPGKNYRLQIKETSFAKNKEGLKLKGVRLTPQADAQGKFPLVSVGLTVPEVGVKDVSVFGGKVKATSITLKSPQIDINKNIQHVESLKIGTEESFANELQHLSIDEVNIFDANIKYTDWITNHNLRTSFDLLRLNSFIWDNDSLRKVIVGELVLHNPGVDIISHARKDSLSDNTVTSTNANNGLVDYFDIGKTTIERLGFSLEVPDFSVAFVMDFFELLELKWKLFGRDSFFDLKMLGAEKPLVEIISHQPYSGPKRSAKNSKRNIEDYLYSALGRFTNKISVGKLSVNNGGIDYSTTDHQTPRIIDKLNKTNLSIEGLYANSIEKDFKIDDIRLGTKNLRFPVNNGFYTINVDSVGITEKASKIYIGNLHMDARYPKMEYAHRHPRSKDWFDVTMGNATIEGINLEKYFTEQVLEISDLQVKDVILQNFKNQKIKIRHNLMPLIYEHLQKLPLKLDVKNTDVENFSVVYEELPRVGDTPGLISLIGLNGHIKGLTNIKSDSGQYINLIADGHLMGSGFFNANWQIPVDTLNDCFILDANLQRFELKELNRLITPMASVFIEDGILNETKFRIEASSEEAHIGMSFLYDKLKINVLKNKEDSTVNDKLATFLVNRVIKSSNPRKKNIKPENVQVSIVRDPYHSTFNYFWQALRPALTESVGVSKGKQNFGKQVVKFVQNIKKFFRSDKDKTSKKESENL